MASASTAVRLPFLLRLPSVSPLLSSLHRLRSLPPPFLLSPPPLASPRRLFCSSSPSLAPVSALPPHPHITQQAQQEDDDDDEPESQGSIIKEEEEEPSVAEPLPRYPIPQLSVKERKELASYAHGLGKKLKSQQVGKSGVTSSVAASFVENLESNELLKLKVHGTCPGELSDVIKLLEEATGSVAVDQIGRSVILYRPSLSKTKKKEPVKPRKTWSTKPKESVPPTSYMPRRVSHAKPSGPGQRQPRRA